MLIRHPFAFGTQEKLKSQAKIEGAKKLKLCWKLNLLLEIPRTVHNLFNCFALIHYAGIT